jgi:hypothetical protein
LSLSPASSATAVGRSTQVGRPVHRSTCRAERRRRHRIGEGRDSRPLDCANAQGWRLRQLCSRIEFYTGTQSTRLVITDRSDLSLDGRARGSDMTNAISRQPGKTIFTIGHGARSEAEFHEVLSGALAEKLPASASPTSGGGRWAGAGRWTTTPPTVMCRGDTIPSTTTRATWRHRSFSCSRGTRETSPRNARRSHVRGDAVVAMQSSSDRRRSVAGGHQVIHLGLGKEQPHHLSEACRIDQTGLLTYDASPGHPSEGPAGPPRRGRGSFSRQSLAETQH